MWFERNSRLLSPPRKLCSETSLEISTRTMTTEHRLIFRKTASLARGQSVVLHHGRRLPVLLDQRAGAVYEVGVETRCAALRSQ